MVRTGPCELAAIRPDVRLYTARYYIINMLFGLKQIAVCTTRTRILGNQYSLKTTETV